MEEDMATERFSAEWASSAAAFRVYGKTGAQAGKVFDFNDNTWKTIGAATTPYVAATKVTDYYGTGKHLFYVSLDLSLLNKTGAVFRYEIALFAGATPVAGDVAVTGRAEFAVTCSTLSDQSPVPRVEFTTNELADELQVSIWLEHEGAKVALSTIGGTPTCRVIAREHGAASGTLTFDTYSPSVTFTRRDEVLEGIVVDPNLTSNVQYMVQVSVTENGTTHAATEIRPIWGS
jgi:hypothetical protein